jgi:hypothetical protein
MASTSPLPFLGRAEYERIGDRVYTTLARRLAVERERRGLA